MKYLKTNNMKYTDGLITIPVRIYDGFSIRRAIKKEEDIDMPVDGDWVAGKAKIPFQKIVGLIDYFSVGRSPEDVAGEGFDCCLVLTEGFGDFIATIPLKEFEDKLNRFADRYDEQIDEMVAKELEDKELNTPLPPPPKRKKFFGII
jgi:hypothetical protein